MSETANGSLRTQGGDFVLPAAVKQLVINLQQRAEMVLELRCEKVTRLEDDEAFAVEAAALTTYVEELLKASRTIVNAYSHAVASPRPSLQKLASAQAITPSNLRRRYTPTHVMGVAELLSKAPSIDVIQHAFPAIADMDLMGISKNIDRNVSLRLSLRAASVSGSLDTLTKVLSPERAREALLKDGRHPPHYGPTGSNGEFEFERVPLGLIGREAVLSAAAALGPEYVKYAEAELDAYEKVSDTARK